MTRPARAFRHAVPALLSTVLISVGSFQPLLAKDQCGAPATRIHVIQGTGLASTRTGEVHEIEGVVVGDFQHGLNGFFVQEEDADADGDRRTSEGIFVFDRGKFRVNAGDRVRVRGKVKEFHGLTELASIAGVSVCGPGIAPRPRELTLPVGAIEAFEAWEGMLVTFPQALDIAEHAGFARYNEVLLSAGAQFQPTARFAPGSAGREKQAHANSLGRILLDDGRNSRYAERPIHPGGGVFDLGNRFRRGDSLQGVTGIVDFGFGNYRIRPIRNAIYTPLNPRPPSPGDIGGSLRIATFNTLNYFTTLADSGRICGPSADRACRGAHTAGELERQRDKLVSALAAMDADIVALVEIENHPADAALADLVGGLNAVAGTGAYAAIDTGTIGSDTIKVALVYRPAAVSPVGGFAILDASVDARFDDGLNRPVLAQAFEEVASAERFTIAVNHLKSKASDCERSDEPDRGDGQGNCNLARKAALAAEVAWLESDPTGSGDPDVIIVGDLNAYAGEDPIAVLETAGYSDLLATGIGRTAYSFLFDGQLGYLDYALANASLREQITGITVWHINADEPGLIDYRTRAGQNALYAPDAFRSSDHDPVIVGLDPGGDRKAASGRAAATF